MISHTNYNRVIPRDFFNESKLLKCMGNLAIKILDNNIPPEIGEIFIGNSGDPFEIRLTDCGHLFVSNCKTYINKHPVVFMSVYNRKSNYPLVCSYGYNECDVFDDDGEFSQEFIDFCKEHSLSRFPTSKA